MDTFYLDCGGMTYPEVVALQKLLAEGGINSYVSTGSLCVHTTRETFLGRFPHLQGRVRSSGEKMFAESWTAAAKEENLIQ